MTCARGVFGGDRGHLARPADVAVTQAAAHRERQCRSDFTLTSRGRARRPQRGRCLTVAMTSAQFDERLGVAQPGRSSPRGPGPSRCPADPGCVVRSHCWRVMHTRRVARRLPTTSCFWQTISLSGRRLGLVLGVAAARRALRESRARDHRLGTIAQGDLEVAIHANPPRNRGRPPSFADVSAAPLKLNAAFAKSTVC